MPDTIARVTKTINAPIEQVWAIVASFGAESLWMPNVVASSLVGYGIGSTRTLNFENSQWMSLVQERMVLCDPETHHVRWTVLNDLVAEAGEIFSEITLSPTVRNQTDLTWSSEGQKLANEAEHAALSKYIAEMYSNCASAIEEKLS